MKREGGVEKEWETEIRGSISPFINELYIPNRSIIYSLIIHSRLANGTDARPCDP